MLGWKKQIFLINYGKREEMSKLEKKSKRQTNIELLRVLALLLIIMYHIVRHTVKVQLVAPEKLARLPFALYQVPQFYPRLMILHVVMTFGSIGNALFILISGYFMANRDQTRIKLTQTTKKLLLQLLFAALVLTVVPTIWQEVWPDFYLSLQRFSRINDEFWFVGYYFAIILCAKLFLNRFLGRLDQKGYASFVLIGLALLTFYWTNHIFESLAEGLEVFVTGIFHYSLGGYLQKYQPLKRVRSYVLVFIPLGAMGLVVLSGYNQTQGAIHDYLTNASLQVTPFIPKVPDYNNSSLLVLVSAVCLFELVRRIQLPQSRLINWLGQATFMVYLIHDNSFFYSLWNGRDWLGTLAYSPWIFIFQLIKWAVDTFVAGALTYLAYQLTLALFKRSKGLFIKSIPEKTES